MAGRYSFDSYSEIPHTVSSEDQVEEKDRGPPAAGTLGSSTLHAGRFVPEDEDEESESPLREQDLKGACIQLVRGEQGWQDGCVYRGEFGLDVKLGSGEFSWPTGESYRGQFYRDHRHGVGTYTWPDGSSFTGTFYLSDREGYGTLCLKAGVFQGLYKADERFGPGIETYPDGSQDVGLWFREHLLKLCVEVPGGFSIRSYPEFSGFLAQPPGRISLLEEERMEGALQEGRDPFFYDYKRLLLDDSLTLPPELYVYSTDHSHLPMTTSFRGDLDARIFLDHVPACVEDGEPWLVRNETPLLVKIQRQTYKFRNQRAHTSWSMDAVLEGKRSGFARRGPRERLSQEMILKAQEGNYDWIYRILKDRLASPDVADARGYTVLAAAAVHCHMDVVSLLLDNGADVNKRTDEGLTALSMCFLLYYPRGAFKANVAERTAPEPQEASKPVTIPSRSFTLEMAEEPAQAQGGQDPKSEGGRAPWEGDPRSSPQRRGSASLRSSASHSGNSWSEGPGPLDRCSPRSNGTDLESSWRMCNPCVEPSQDPSEWSARAHSPPEAPAAPTGESAVKRMARSAVQRRHRWLTINLLLRRGADPNLCRVPMQVLFLAVKAGDADGVELLLRNGARTDIQFPPQLGALTPLHLAAALPGDEGVRITELLLHAITDVDARAADQDDVYKQGKPDLLPSSLKLSGEAGPPSTYYSGHSSAPDEGGRTALHVACERKDSHGRARDIVRLLLSHRANPNTLWSGHSPLSLSIASGNDLIVKELLSCGADPNLPLTEGLGSALCVACDLTYESQWGTDGKLALIDRLISHGADILNPVTIMQGDKVAVGTAVDYGYFKFYQDRRIAHSPFHTLMPAERETFLARKKILEYMGVQLRRAVFAKECQWDQKVLNLSKRAELAPFLRTKLKGPGVSKGPDLEEQDHIPFFKFCAQCGRSVGVRLSPCARCYGILTCSKYCKTRAWTNFHKRDCSSLTAIAACPGAQQDEEHRRADESP